MWKRLECRRRLVESQEEGASATLAAVLRGAADRVEVLAQRGLLGRGELEANGAALFFLMRS